MPGRGGGGSSARAAPGAAERGPCACDGPAGRVVRRCQRNAAVTAANKTSVIAAANRTLRMAEVGPLMFQIVHAKLSGAVASAGIRVAGYRGRFVVGIVDTRAQWRMTEDSSWHLRRRIGESVSPLALRVSPTECALRVFVEIGAVFAHDAVLDSAMLPLRRRHEPVPVSY